MKKGYSFSILAVILVILIIAILAFTLLNKGLNNQTVFMATSIAVVFSGIILIGKHNAIVKAHKESLLYKSIKYLLLKVQTLNNLTSVSMSFIEFKRLAPCEYDLLTFKDSVRRLLVKRYRALQRLQEFSKNLKIDTLYYPGIEPEIKVIFEQVVVEGSEVLETLDQLFEDHYKKLKKKGFPSEETINLLLWCKDDLNLFKPFERFTKKLAKIKAVLETRDGY